MKWNSCNRLAVLISLFAVTPVAPGQPCEPEWADEFGGYSFSAPVLTSLVYETAGRPVLVAGGDFGAVGALSATRIAIWDGNRWDRLGGGLGGDVRALARFDDGAGEALYAAGDFLTAGGLAARRIAKWDGTSWSALGLGIGNTSSASVHALAVFDDGSGPALYAGGQFPTAGTSAAARLARWDGATWSSVGGGIPLGTVYALGTFNDGAGTALYVGGVFATAGTVPANNIARWNGQTWSALGAGVDGKVATIAVANHPANAAMYVGGSFTSAGGAPAQRVARWDGNTWSPLGAGLNNTVNALAVGDASSEHRLYAGGIFVSAGNAPALRIAGWDGSQWHTLAAGVDNAVHTISVLPDGEDTKIVVGGAFTSAGGSPIQRLAAWNEQEWKPLGDGVDLWVFSLTSWSDASGPALYAGGHFTSAGGVAANKIARFDGTNWRALPGIPSTSYGVLALGSFEDQNGSALYAGGGFSRQEGAPANYIARWDGAAWSELGSGPGLSGWVRTMLVHDDGTGQALYVGGQFTQANGSPAGRIARWDGQSWAPVGLGFNDHVYSLEQFQDSQGTALYAGGKFTHSGGVAVNGIAKWDGQTWAPLQEGVSGGFQGSAVYALETFDDGSGPALFVGGYFTRAGLTSASRIARWNGDQWHSLGTGLFLWSFGENTNVSALHAFDDGRNSALFATGSFDRAGGAPASYIARWDGSSWSTLGSGLSQSGSVLHSFAVPGERPRLYVGGSFHRAGAFAAQYLSSWGCDSPSLPVCPANCDASTIPPILNVDDFTCFINAFAAAGSLPHEKQVAHYANCDASTIAPALNVDDFTCFINAFAAGCP